MSRQENHDDPCPCDKPMLGCRVEMLKARVSDFASKHVIAIGVLIIISIFFMVFMVSMTSMIYFFAWLAGMTVFAIMHATCKRYDKIIHEPREVVEP